MCDEYKKELRIDDICITFPSGAIPAGVTAHVEIGVALHGPYSFPDGYQPVSPIIWLCIQEEFELLVPISIELPHMVMDIEGMGLTFAKANHLKYCYDSTNGSKVFVFKNVTGGTSFFTNLTEETAVESGYGILHVKHCCLYCILAKKSPTLEKNIGYCLHTFIEEKSQSCHILHICTYYLKLCLKASLDSH